MKLFKKLKDALSFRGAKGMMSGLILGVIAITLAIILVVQVIAPQLSLNATQQGYLGTGGYALWGILGLVIVAGIVFLVLRTFGIIGGNE